jgi:hypothetical protein
MGGDFPNNSMVFREGESNILDGFKRVTPVKGAFNNYVDRILPFFDVPHPLRGQFLYPERGQKQTFLDPLPPHLVRVVIECPLKPELIV